MASVIVLIGYAIEQFQLPFIIFAGEEHDEFAVLGETVNIVEYRMRSKKRIYAADAGDKYEIGVRPFNPFLYAGDYGGINIKNTVESAHNIVARNRFFIFKDSF